MPEDAETLVHYEREIREKRTMRLNGTVLL
jgi:hypothetical protein